MHKSDHSKIVWKPKGSDLGVLFAVLCVVLNWVTWESCAIFVIIREGGQDQGDPRTVPSKQWICFSWAVSTNSPKQSKVFQRRGSFSIVSSWSCFLDLYLLFQFSQITVAGSQPLRIYYYNYQVTKLHIHLHTYETWMFLKICYRAPKWPPVSSLLSA